MKYILSAMMMAGLQVGLVAQTDGKPAPAADLRPLLQIVSAAINPDADGDRTELIRKGLAALADLNTAGTKPEQAVEQAKTQGSLSGGKTEKMGKMLLEMWSLNTDRMAEPATLEALRAGKMPSPPLKRP